MKRLISSIWILILIVSPFVFSGCEKLEIKQDLIGSWSIFGTGGGIGGQGTPYYFNTLRILKKDDYQFFRNDTLIEKGSYKISNNENDRFKGIGDFLINFNSEYKLGYGASILTNDIKVIQQISNDTIGLLDMYADGFGFYFKKLDK